MVNFYVRGNGLRGNESNAPLMELEMARRRSLDSFRHSQTVKLMGRAGVRNVKNSSEYFKKKFFERRRKENPYYANNSRVTLYNPDQSSEDEDRRVSRCLQDLSFDMFQD